MRLRYVFVVLALILLPVCSWAQTPVRVQHGFTLVSVDFGHVPIGTTKDTTVTAFIRNLSFNTDTVFGVRLSGERPENFALVEAPDMPLVLIPADSAAFRFTFTPNVLELVQANLEVFTEHDTVIAILFGGGRVAAVNDERTVADADGLRCIPNVTAAGATIEYRVTRPGRVRVMLLDMLGRHVATVLDHEVETGSHEVRLELTGLAAGAYRCVLDAGDRRHSAPLHIIR